MTPGDAAVSVCMSAGKVIAEQVDRIAALEAKVLELEDKLRFKQMDCDTWQRDAEGKLEDRTRLEHELTASRQQVERLGEALRLYDAFAKNTLGYDDRDYMVRTGSEALAAVEKERHNGGGKRSDD